MGLIGVEIQSAHTGTAILVVLRILTFLSNAAVLICLGLFAVGACILLFTDHALALGLSYVFLFSLALSTASVALCLHVSVLWAWYRMPVAERHQFYGYATHLRSYRRWRQSFYHERSRERPAERAYVRILLMAENSPHKRWMGWAVIPASLLFSATAVSFDLLRSSSAHWNGFELLFVVVGWGLAMAASALLPRS
jgi:hypothetical protein